ncbi:LSM8 (YJR022W) [Zygosaccharomyces parabailii]|nr:LSM8 (YJR022W) [Zygosaccharomyces parabailii]CDH15463.1 related to U6 snRNA-associated Sm-like protein LSm8 [Zygosaccharomyces bailii ISA1307]
MSPLLKDYLNRRVLVITTAGECLLATLEGFDKNTNLIMSDVIDRCSLKPIAMAQAVRGSEIVTIGPFEGSLEPSETLPKLKDTRNRVKDEYLIWEKVWQKHS